MKTSLEYLEQATKYELLAAQATKEQRQVGYRNVAQVYRHFAEQVAVQPTLSGALP